MRRRNLKRPPRCERRPHSLQSPALRPALALALVLLAACPKPAAPPHLTSNVVDWRDEVIYQLLTDRFANGDPSNDTGVVASDRRQYHGGDFAGIEAQIPYLQDLGVTTVWI